MDLSKLLKPRKMAIVGANEKKSLGGLTVKIFLERCQERLKDLYLVNPNRAEVFGIKTYPTLEAIPEDIDLVIIATPKATVGGLITEAARKGAGGAVVYASGYGETGKAEDRQAELDLKSLCDDLDVALMGPNCAGFVNFVDRIFSFGFTLRGHKDAGKVGLVAQSGQICQSLYDSPKTRFSYLISSGNSKIVTTEDYLDFLVEDESTRVVAAYIEGVTQPAKFAAVLKKAAGRRKPVVILKAGRSEKGCQLAASHTGSMSGSDKTFDAVFAKFGVIRVNDMEELIGVTTSLALMPSLPPRNAFTAVNVSGGETTICADMGWLAGINFPEFAPQTIEKLKGILPDFATPNNPLDTTATVCYDADVYASVLDLVLSDSNVEAMIIGFTIGPDEDQLSPSVEVMTRGIERFMTGGNKKPILVMPSIESGRVQKYCDRLADVGVPVLPPPVYAYNVVRYIVNYSQWLSSVGYRTLAIAPPEETAGKTIALSEHESKELLQRFGVPVSREALAKTAEEAVEIATKMGFPLAMKIESADILHKSDVGGVKLNVGSAAEVKRFYRELLANAREHKPDAKINGVLLQEMLSGKGLEVIVGVKNDPQFGPMVLFGIGGIFVEVFKDVSLYPAPFGPAEALMMVDSLQAAKLFHGYRGRAELDIEALTRAMVAVSNFAVANKNVLVEMDINPLFVFEKGKGVVAADGLVIMKK